MSMHDPYDSTADVSGRRLDPHAREQLRAIAAEIVSSFLGEPNRKLGTSRQWRWGRKGSFTLNVAGDKTGLWYDHENEIGGDIINFLQVQLGCSIADAITYALSYLGPSWSSRSTLATSRPLQAEPDDAVRVNQALRIWSGVLPLHGSLAERYLAGRGIRVPDEALEVLGFHPNCPFGSRRAPALVALIQDITTGEPVGIHRRELIGDATAAGPSMSLGPKSDGVIRLSPAISTELTIGEGVETCLAGIMLGSGPTWSVLDAGGISNFIVLEQVQHLTILVDHDVSGTGQRAAAACRDRWFTAGKRVRLAMPDTPGQDFNDLLLAELGSSPQHA